jgi:hypothetical protein
MEMQVAEHAVDFLLAEGRFSTLKDYEIRELQKTLSIRTKELGHQHAKVLNRLAEIKAVRKGKGGINLSEYHQDLIKEREELKQKGAAILSELKETERQLQSLPSTNDYKYFREVVRELFTREQLQIIGREANNRMRGGKNNISLVDVTGNADETKKYKELSENLLAQLIEARKSLNDVIFNGCKKYGNADFLITVSPVNQALKPIAELGKLKRVYHLK